MLAAITHTLRNFLLSGRASACRRPVAQKRNLLRTAGLLIGAIVASLGACQQAGAADDWFERLATLTPQAALEQLEQAPAAYRQRSDYYYWLGVYSQRAGLPDILVIEHFEHALMLNPNHAGAWYDYGLALCRTGDVASCQTVLETAHTRFGTPPALAGESGQLERPRFALAGEFRSNVGYSSNLNFGSGVESINLRLNGQDINLALASSSRAQSAFFGDAALDLKVIPTDAPEFTAMLTTYERFPQQNRDLIGDYRAIVGDLIYAPTPTQRVGLQGYSMNDSRLGSLSVVGAWWQLQQSRQGMATYLAAERRSPSGTLASYTTLRAEQVALIWRSLEGRIGAESDLPHGDRPGYSQQRLFLGWRLPVHILGQGQLELSGRWQDAQDSQTYSPLFGDEPRRISTRESRLRLSWPLGARVDLRFDARYTRQTSNIALFDLDEKYISAGIAARF